LKKLGGIGGVFFLDIYLKTKTNNQGGKGKGGKKA
jgi:hypothetical protein